MTVQPLNNKTEPAVPLPFVTVSDWQGKSVPDRKWLVKNRIPMAAVTLLSGDGAAGKTTIALQLAAATGRKTDRGTDWLGGLIDTKGPVIFITAEEDEDEVHRRFGSICSHFNHSYEDLDRVHVLCVPTEYSAFANIDNRLGKVTASPLFEHILATAEFMEPALIIIEAAADVFPGDENVRSQVRQFIGLLRKLATKSGAAVVLISHPSLSGLNSGSGTSGSTHWNNSVRSRLYFSAVKSRDDEGPESTLRELKVMKANYGPSGEAVRVKWQRGVFVMDSGAPALERAAAESAIDAAFLRCLDIKTAQGINVGHKPSRSSAPNVFADMAEAEGASSGSLTRAMERLLAAGKVKVEPCGPPSHHKTRLARSTPC